MSKLVLNGKMARALAVIGGRKLAKVVDSLLARIKSTLAFKDISVHSDGRYAYLEIDGKKLVVETKTKHPEISSGYFKFQDGIVVFTGPEAELRLVKNVLVEIAKERVDYLLDMYRPEQLAYYDITPGYLRKLPALVEDLEIE